MACSVEGVLINHSCPGRHHSGWRLTSARDQKNKQGSPSSHIQIEIQISNSFIGIQLCLHEEHVPLSQYQFASHGPNTQSLDVGIHKACRILQSNTNTESQLHPGSRCSGIWGSILIRHTSTAHFHTALIQSACDKAQSGSAPSQAHRHPLTC